MRKTLTALAVLLFFAVPIAGHASPFQYTMTLDFPSYRVFSRASMGRTRLLRQQSWTTPTYLLQVSTALNTPATHISKCLILLGQPSERSQI